MCSGLEMLSPGETGSGICQFEIVSIIWTAIDIRVDFTILLILSLTERGYLNFDCVSDMLNNLTIMLLCL